MKKLKLKFLTTVILIFMGPLAVFAGLNNFQMFWGFTNSTGSNGTWSRNDVCVGDTIYIRNLSNYNGSSPIPNTLSGTYRIYNAVGNSNGVLIGTIPAQSWPYNGVYAFPLPANSIFNYAIGLNIRIYYSGSDVTTGDRDNMCYLTTRALPSVNAGVDQSVCLGESVQLTGSGASSYTWNPGGISGSSIQVAPTTSINYTLSGSVIYNNTSIASMTQSLTCSNTDVVNVTVLPSPVINLPSEIAVCNSNFYELCGPSNSNNNFTYNWSLAGLPFSLSPNQCYTPTQYGNYTLIVTNQYGCSSTHTISIIEGFGPEISINDYNYCKKTPFFVGLSGPYSDALYYEWTYNGGTPFTGGYRIPNMGDGEYCVTVYWSDANVPSLIGCTSTTCFNVQECCEPNSEFILTYDPSGATATITVQDIPAYSVLYDSDQFVLYKYCGTETNINLMTWIQVGVSPWTSNFNNPVVFSGLDKNCVYKVAHRVKKVCKHKIYVHEELVINLKINVYPNPSIAGQPVTVEMTTISEPSVIEISNMVTGKIIYQGKIEYSSPIKIDHSVFSDKGNTLGMYNIKVYNNHNVVNEKLIIR